MTSRVMKAWTKLVPSSSMAPPANAATGSRSSSRRPTQGGQLTQRGEGTDEAPPPPLHRRVRLAVDDGVGPARRPGEQRGTEPGEQPADAPFGQQRGTEHERELERGVGDGQAGGRVAGLVDDELAELRQVVDRLQRVRQLLRIGRQDQCEPVGELGADAVGVDRGLGRGSGGRGLGRSRGGRSGGWCCSRAVGGGLGDRVEGGDQLGSPLLVAQHRQRGAGLAGGERGRGGLGWARLCRRLGTMVARPRRPTARSRLASSSGRSKRRASGRRACASARVAHIVVMVTLLTILVGLAMLGTVGVLVVGMVGMVRGADPMRSNVLMRWRVVLQGVALLLFVMLLSLLRH